MIVSSEIPIDCMLMLAAALVISVDTSNFGTQRSEYLNIEIEH